MAGLLTSLVRMQKRREAMLEMPKLIKEWKRVGLSVQPHDILLA